ncbi:hypothetical protein D3C78_1538320 [compost metagenome]
MHILHAVVAVAFGRAYGQVLGIDGMGRDAQPGEQMRHAGHGMGHQILEPQEIQALANRGRKIVDRLQ